MKLAESKLIQEFTTRPTIELMKHLQLTSLYILDNTIKSIISKLKATYIIFTNSYSTHNVCLQAICLAKWILPIFI